MLDYFIFFLYPPLIFFLFSALRFHKRTLAKMEEMIKNQQEMIQLLKDEISNLRK
jgi:hypothetical protein